MIDAEHSLDLEALLDPARLAAAWQIAHERPAVVEAAGEAAGELDAEAGVDVEIGDGDSAAFAAEATNVELVAAAEASAPVRAVPAPLPVASAHRLLLYEIEHTLAAAPAIADKARRALAALLAKLAQAIDPESGPLDLAAAEAVLDQLEDVWQALLSEAAWPKIIDRDED